MKNRFRYQVYLLISAVAIIFNSCEEFVDIESPNYILDRQAVFTNEQSAFAALNGLYNHLFNTSFANGGGQSVSYLGALSGDNLILTSFNGSDTEFYRNNITVTNNENLNLWSGCYNIIYQANALYEGAKNANNLSDASVDRIIGSALFVRAFTYFYLVNLYNSVPLIITTNYQDNAGVQEYDKEGIYKQILIDLEQASDLLDPSYPDQEKTQPNRFAALAMLARVHLFLGNYQEAIEYSNQVISNTTNYELLEDINEVFLANSQEAIWQISPIGAGSGQYQTRDGNLLIKTPTSSTPAALQEDFVSLFSDSDLRGIYWIGHIEINADTVYFPYKYKIQYDTSGESQEYSMVLRLSEQFLIRSEARAMLGNLTGAIEDLNVVRNRAQAPILEVFGNMVTQEDLLDIIIKERRKEFFTEWGHRWLDIKRFTMESQISPKEGNEFESTRSWNFPIPSIERLRNPNLGQNPGY